MLTELRIRNFAIIEVARRCRSRRASTCSRARRGRGSRSSSARSGCLLGERANADVIRTGADRATVEGVFDVADRPEIRALLDERGIDVDDSLVVLKREVTAGRARAWINGTPVNASILAEVGRLLVNLHGQHEAQTLLDADGAAAHPRCVRRRGRRCRERGSGTRTSSPRRSARSPTSRSVAPTPSGAPTISGTSCARSATPSWSMAKTHGSRTRRDGWRTRTSCARWPAGLAVDARRRRGRSPPATRRDREALVVDPADRSDVVAAAGDVRLGVLRDRSAGPRADGIRGDDRPRSVASRGGQRRDAICCFA